AIAVGGYFAVDPLVKNVRLGLDIKGGIFVLLEAVETEGKPVDKDTIERTVARIRNRVDQLGVTEPEIAPEADLGGKQNRIRVLLPGVQDRQRAIEIIGRTALLEFKDPEGKTFLTGEELIDAQALRDPGTFEPEVIITLSPKGADIFEQKTTELLQRQIPIVLDGSEISSPVVQSPGIREPRITGLTIEEAADLALLLRSGALPVALERRQVVSVGPTLGADSTRDSVKAGWIGLTLLAAFMIVYYRIPGFLACIALAVYVGLVLAALIGLKATLTLPGIAGLLLSMGMAVDANVIIFERIREELARGKTIRSSIESGFSRALLTIVDSNVTTLIAAAALIKWGTGPIRGFAVVLAIGLVASMLTAVVLTRFMIRLTAEAEIVKGGRLFSGLRWVKEATPS
ncbi:MAG: protein translocase subunit SecD, partial [Firmicutes bacterium]|nr:protein translocase subunit SecD [Bacillota bacterium]